MVFKYKDIWHHCGLLASFLFFLGVKKKKEVLIWIFHLFLYATGFPKRSKIIYKIKRIVKMKYFFPFLTAIFLDYVDIANRQDAETCDLLCHNYVEILSFKTYFDLWIMVTKNITQTISFNYMKCNEAMRQLNTSRHLLNISIF